jgi:ATP-binding cassette subfamily C protein/ATP-binding cassette subfamily C protein EexD
LPQDVELFSGTVAENISRFQTMPDEEKVINAAQMAGVHDMVQSLTAGYNTRSRGGQSLSRQRQRLRLGALACLPGDPR